MRFKLTRHLPQPPERVWEALTRPEQLAAWLMDNDFQPQPGASFTFRKPPQKGWDGIIHCEVLELEAPRRLAYAWRGQATGEKTLRCAGVDNEAVAATGSGFMTKLDTVVRFTLHPERGGTRVEFEHDGFEGLQGAIVSFVMGMGWKKLFGKLERTLA